MAASLMVPFSVVVCVLWFYVETRHDGRGLPTPQISIRISSHVNGEIRACFYTAVVHGFLER